MPGTTISGSPNISLLDSKIVADVCAGNFVIDATPSIFIGSGASNVLGVKVKIVNPYGVIIKDYTASYDIAPPISGSYTRTIPTQAGKIQYGTYTVYVQLTDAGGTTYEVVKSVNVCTYDEVTNPCDIRLQLTADCKNGRLTVALSEPPVFKGFYAESRTQTIVVNYPTASGVTPLTTSNGMFAVQLFEGEYKVVTTVCATYNLTDNVYLKLGYTGTFYKKVRCLLDYTCIWPRIKQLWDKINEDCSQIDRDNNASIALQASLLVHTINLANDAGEDASDYIDQLEKLLGCTCTCDCNGLPILNGAPSSNILIQGCNVISNVVGLTTIYQIDNYEFIIQADPTQNVITVSNPAMTSCTFMQQVRFSIANAYAGIKTQINNITEYNFWAGIIRLALAGVDVSCLTAPTTTLAQLIQSIIDKACIGGNCSATIATPATAQSGNDVVLTWAQTGGYSTDIYVDGILMGNVLAAVGTFTVVGGTDGNVHTYYIVPKCSNGSNGIIATGTFVYLACPTIAPPVVSSNTVNNATCPYDLTSLLSAPPLGITVEWHTANNTSAGSLVADPTDVSSGVYYAFAKDADGCFSTATTVTLICASATSCTAPQSLLVTPVGGDFVVTFNSAAFPPPANSYTVKRRLASDPDVSGSYTTIGTPTFNVTTSKWTITDTSGVDNTLYVYKAISNCGGSPATTPEASYTFVNITCPSLTFTPGGNSIDYSFTHLGGNVDKYEVKIYDSTGSVLIHTDTIVPVFSSPITGTFLYLAFDTDYIVVVTPFVGTISHNCSGVSVSTQPATFSIINYNSTADITTVNPSPVYTLETGSLPLSGSALGSELKGVHIAFASSLVVTINGSTGGYDIRLWKNGILQEILGETTDGTFTFAAVSFLSTDVVLITVI